MKHKVSELEGALLDAAVAKAEGYELDSDGDNRTVRDNGGAPSRWRPSTDWTQGGPIIEREEIDEHTTVLEPVSIYVFEDVEGDLNAVRKIECPPPCGSGSKNADRGMESTHAGFLPHAFVQFFFRLDHADERITM